MTNSGVIETLELEIERLRDDMLAFEAEAGELVSGLHPAFRESGRNLLHYLALRQRDVRDLQHALAGLGLSSLGRAEGHVLRNVETVLGVLRRLCGHADAETPPTGISADVGRSLLDLHTRNLLGEPPRDRRVRIMVTLPSEAADDRALAHDLSAAGMDCARINCAHDGPDVWAEMVENVRRAERETGHPCHVEMDLGGPKLRTGAVEKRVELKTGDRLELTRSQEPGREATTGEDGRDAAPARVPCALPEVFGRVRAGERVFLDDGKIAGVVRAADDERIEVEVTRTRAKGRKLGGDKGINLPDTDLALPALTDKDRADLPFVVEHADIVALSFVHDPSDIDELDALARELGAEQLGLILKIETRRAFENLPSLLFAAMSAPRRGVMIARGDLAVECGFERLAEVQEEILWLCEAGHMPVIWATQVLETLAKEGAPPRAEITDAAMSNRAECVMLNKGPHVVEAVRVLDDILRRMAEHQSKKSSMMRPLAVARRQRRVT
jgi:pyruvate kinase